MPLYLCAIVRNFSTISWHGLCLAKLMKFFSKNENEKKFMVFEAL